MKTNLEIDDSLIKEALILGGFKTKNDAVNTALREFVNRRKQPEIIELFGKLEPDTDYDYKECRKR